MESGPALDLFGLLGEGDASLSDCLVEFRGGCNVLVDDRLVNGSSTKTLALSINLRKASATSVVLFL